MRIWSSKVACPSSAKIRIIDFPQDHAEMIELSMLWHSRVHDDPGSLWLRALIREAISLSADALRLRGSVTRRAPLRTPQRQRKPKKGAVCVPKTLNPTIVVMKSAKDGA
jgi:hypothetical protein